MRHLRFVFIILVFALSAIPAYAGRFDRAAMVAAHNQWRAKVGVGKLTYSKKLEAASQVWAIHLKMTNACKMQHSKPHGRYGENLYWASAIMWTDGHRDVQKVTPQMVVDAWGSEKADYDYATNGCKPGKMCGHYTQMVWKTTTTVGCGYAVCADTKEQIWVCRYQPPGNWVGKKPY